MRNSYPTTLATLGLALSATVLLSACRTHRSDTNAIPPTDVRYLKDFKQPGKWFCSAHTEYSQTSDEGSDEVLKSTVVVTADSGLEAKKKLSEACADAPENAIELCEKIVSAENYPCVHASLYASPYTEISKSTGHWACAMDYHYSIEEKIKASKKKPAVDSKNKPSSFLTLNDDAETTKERIDAYTSRSAVIDAKVLASESPAPSPTVSPAPVPSPRPTSRIVIKSEKIESEGSTESLTIAAAFEKCGALTDADARSACADQMIALKMQCWNRDLGKNARPKAKIIRR